MSLLGHLCNRQREVEVVRRNAALPSAKQEASTNRTHDKASPVPETHAGEGPGKLGIEVHELLRIAPEKHIQ